MLLSLAILMLSLAPQTAAVAEQEKPLPDRTTFLIEFQVKRPGLKKVFGGYQDSKILSQYTYTEKVTELSLDSNGKTKSTQTDIFHMIPTRLQGYIYRRQIVKKGVPLTEQELQKQDQNHEKDLAKSEAERRKWEAERLKNREEARRKLEQTLNKQFDKEKLTGEERGKRLEENLKIYDATLAGGRPPNAPPPSMNQSPILMAVDFQIVRREIVDGYRTILLTYKPNPGYKSTDDLTKILQHTTGRVWVSEDEYEPVKLEVQVIDPITFGMGLLAKVQANSNGIFEWRKINNEIWMPSREEFTAKVRILLVKGEHFREIHEYSDHKKYVVDTRLTFGEIPPTL